MPKSDAFVARKLPVLDLFAADGRDISAAVDDELERLDGGASSVSDDGC